MKKYIIGFVLGIALSIGYTYTLGWVRIPESIVSIAKKCKPFTYSFEYGSPLEENPVAAHSLMMTCTYKFYDPNKKPEPIGTTTNNGFVMEIDSNMPTYTFIWGWGINSLPLPK